MFRLPLLVLLALVLALSAAHADVRLPAILGDNMVLQQGLPLKIWGWADPGETVTVAFRGQTVQATANDRGEWLVRLKPVKAGGPFDMTVAGKNTLTLKNLLVGEVWVCSGQSNMGMTVNGCKNADREMAAANYPSIRLFTVDHVTSQEPKDDTKGQWLECNPANVAWFSGTGYFFGRDLHQALKVPVGLINSSWGGTCAEAWTTLPSLQADPDYKAQFDYWEKVIADYPAALENYNKAMVEWKKACEQATAEGKPQPAQPWAPPGSDSANRPACLYNAMISPIINFPIRGAIWYQGESNAGRAYMYRKLLPLMIADWRAAWGYDFPFYIVSLANYTPPPAQPGESSWAELREAQSMTARMPNNGLAVIIDVGDAADIHPGDKQTVGARLALQAEAKTYGMKVRCESPSYTGMSVEGHRIRLRFKDTYGQLMAKDGKRPIGFAIAGADKQFVWASARIEGDTMVVYSHKVRKPVAVRYAWAENPPTNLYNAAGLPMDPFRTDDWPGCTISNR